MKRAAHSPAGVVPPRRARRNRRVQAGDAHARVGRRGTVPGGTDHHEPAPDTTKTFASRSAHRCMLISHGGGAPSGMPSASFSLSDSMPGTYTAAARRRSGPSAPRRRTPSTATRSSNNTGTRTRTHLRLHLRLIFLGLVVPAAARARAHAYSVNGGGAQTARNRTHRSP